MRFVTTLGGVALVLAGLTSGAVASSSSSRISSPTVVGSYVAEAENITLLILWRGSPGWFFRGSNGTSGSAWGSASSNGARNESMSTSFGGLTFNVDINYQAGTAKIQGYDFALQDTNVVMFDQVDSPGGPQLAGTRRLDLSLPTTSSGDPLQIAISRHRELYDYLQCGTELPDAVLPPGPPTVRQYTRTMMTLVCDTMRGQ